MRTLSTIVLFSATFLTFATGCTGPGTADGDLDAYRAVLPSSRVEVNLDTDYANSRAIGDMAEGYKFTARVTDNVNGMIRNVLDTVETVTDLEPSWADHEDNTAVWGPFSDDLDPREVAVWVHYDDPTDVYTWGMAHRERGSETWDDFEPFIVGQVNAGAVEDDNDGWFYFDYDAAAPLEPSGTIGGKFLSSYDLDPDSVTASAAFEDFVGEVGAEPVNAVYSYEQDAAGGQMDLIYKADVDGGAALETVAMRTRWMADGSGRSDAAVADGDLNGQVGLLSECWDVAPNFGRSFYTNNWSASQTEGDVDNCVFETEEYSEETASR